MHPLEFPKLEKYVNDFSGVLPPGDIEALNELFALHEKNTSEQVVVVFFPHREGHELIDIGLKIFNENGIGQKGKNNGLLLIIATEEKKIRLITGKGMEIKYSEMRCRDIIENDLRSLLERRVYRTLIEKFNELIQKEYPGTGEGMSRFFYEEGRKQKNRIMSLGLIASFLALIFVEGIIGGILSLIVSLAFITALWNTKYLFSRWTILSISCFPFVLFVIGFLGIIAPTHCTFTPHQGGMGGTYYCERTVFGYEYHYTRNTLGGGSNMSGYRGSSSSDWGSSSSDWGSSSSSFGGGGGSSNGGGYGD